MIYNSVLISGLIFNKKAVAALKIDKQYFAQAIYTQVYLSTMTVLKDEAYGTAPSGILEVGGDGENFFGKNQSATNRDLISDRKQISSDLNYQQFLLRVVDRISVDSGKEISKLFWKNYSKRLLGYGFKARSLGLSKYKVFLKAYFNDRVKKTQFISFLFICLILMPAFFSKYIFKLGRFLLRTSG